MSQRLEFHVDQLQKDAHRNSSLRQRESCHICANWWRIITSIYFKADQTVEGCYWSSDKERGRRVKAAKPGQKPKFSERMRQSIVWRARKDNFNVRQLRNHFEAPISVQQAQQILSPAEYLEYENLKKAPKLLPSHKAARISLAHSHIAKSPLFWKQIIWNDAKRFCLDRPDGCQFYWADSRVEKRYCSTRSRGEGGIMVWGEISYRGKAKLMPICKTIDSQA